MTDKPSEETPPPPPSAKHVDDEGPYGSVIVDPFTGERIFSPKRAKLIEEDLARQIAKREKSGGPASQP